MISKKAKKNLISSICMFATVASCTTVLAASESYTTTYSFACSVTSRTHTASGTPTVTVTTSNMVGDYNDKLWVELDKKHVWGWAASGSGSAGYTQVSSTTGSTFSLTGKDKGTYRLLFGKSSMLLSGSYDQKSPKWSADLSISYNK